MNAKELEERVARGLGVIEIQHCEEGAVCIIGKRPGDGRKLLEAFARAAIRATVEACAEIASTHKPPSVKFSVFDEEEYKQSVRDEERGEDIAAKEIAKKLQSLIPESEDEALAATEKE